VFTPFFSTIEYDLKNVLCICVRQIATSDEALLNIGETTPQKIINKNIFLKRQNKACTVSEYGN